MRHQRTQIAEINAKSIKIRFRDKTMQHLHLIIE